MDKITRARRFAQARQDERGQLWSVIDLEAGYVVIRDESYQIAANLEWALNTGAVGCSELDEVASKILSTNSSTQGG